MAEGHEETTREMLEQRRLALEVLALERKASWQGRLVELLQAAAIPATIISVAFSVFFSLSQLHRADDARIDDRFDKALTRLASDQQAVRISGVSGLRLFISNGEASRRAEAVQFLIDALAAEKDPVVQSTILAVIDNLKAMKLDGAAIDAALETAIERNRSLTNYLNTQMAPSDAPLRAVIGRRNAIDPATLPDPLPQPILAKLTPADYREAVPIKRSFVARIASDQAQRLLGLTAAIVTLLRQGGRASDFSGIFCEDCDFTVAKDLSWAHFDGAYLARADFSHMQLRGATFRDADLGNTYFFAAHLENGDFSTVDKNSVVRWNQMIAGLYRSLPLLDCAHLEGANLTRLPLLSIWNTGAGSIQYIMQANLQSAIVDARTRVEELGIIQEDTANDAILARYPPEALQAMDTAIRASVLGHKPGLYRFVDTDPNSIDRAPAVYQNLIGYSDRSIEAPDDARLRAGGNALALGDPVLDWFLPKFLRESHLQGVALTWVHWAPQGRPSNVADGRAADDNACEAPGHPPLNALVTYPLVVEHLYPD